MDDSSLNTPLPPRVVKDVEDCEVIEGGAAKFICCISGNPTPSISWYKGDEKLNESREYSMLVESPEKYALIITHSDTDLAGSYTCEATNSEGSVKSTANLSVTSRQSPPEEQGDDDIQQWDALNVYEKQEVEIKKEKVEDYFTLQGELGRGKFGVVYKCVDKATDQEYAAKFIKCRPAQKKDMLNEISIMNTLHHKLITNLVGAFEASRQFVLVLELVSGGELFERLVEEELISEMDVTFYMKQVLCGIKHMHDLHILHLDLKPENIMLVNKNSTQIKLIDFGLARRINQGPVKVLCGTPEFVSPEVLSYDEVSPATDMWSIGVITYLLLSGYSPFAGDTDPETMANITRGEWDFDDEVFDDISDEAKDFITKLLIKKLKSRSLSDECLKHPWLKVKTAAKKIKTAQLASFLAKRNWKKSIAAIQTTNFLSKLAASATSDDVDAGMKETNGDDNAIKAHVDDVSEQPSVTKKADNDGSKQETLTKEPVEINKSIAVKNFVKGLMEP